MAVKVSNTSFSVRPRRRTSSLRFGLVQLFSAIAVIASIAAEDPAERQEQVEPASMGELAETARQIIANDSVSDNVARLIAIDSSLKTQRSSDARKRILVALARSGDHRGVAYVRSEFEDDADRRNDAAYALSLSPAPDLADWRFSER